MYTFTAKGRADMVQREGQEEEERKGDGEAERKGKGWKIGRGRKGMELKEMDGGRRGKGGEEEGKWRERRETRVGGEQKDLRKEMKMEAGYRARSHLSGCGAHATPRKLEAISEKGNPKRERAAKFSPGSAPEAVARAQRGGAGEERRQLAEVRAVELEEALLGLLKLEEVVSDTLRLGPSREVAIGREPEHLCFF